MQLSTVGDQAFPEATGHVWNSLLQQVMSAIAEETPVGITVLDAYRV